METLQNMTTGDGAAVHPSWLAEIEREQGLVRPSGEGWMTAAELVPLWPYATTRGAVSKQAESKVAAGEWESKSFRGPNGNMTMNYRVVEGGE